ALPISTASGGGAATRLTPMPTARWLTAPPCPALSRRIPATLPPFRSTSFGHFRVRVAPGPTACPSASASARAATKLRWAAETGSPAGRITRVAEKFPSGEIQARPRRPRAAVWRRARIQAGCVRCGASRCASELVLSTSARTWRATPSGQTGPPSVRSADKNFGRQSRGALDAEKVHDARHHDDGRGHEQDPLRRHHPRLQPLGLSAEVHVVDDAQVVEGADHRGDRPGDG